MSDARVAGGVATPCDGKAPKLPRRDLVVLIDLQALRRGRAESGETCEIDGVGPVPVEVAADFSGDPFLKAVITHGRDIRTVAHFGRHVPEELRTALLVRDRCCDVPWCEAPPHHRMKDAGFFLARDDRGHRAWVSPSGFVIGSDPGFDPTSLAKAPPVEVA